MIPNAPPPTVNRNQNLEGRFGHLTPKEALSNPEFLFLLNQEMRKSDAIQNINSTQSTGSSSSAFLGRNGFGTTSTSPSLSRTNSLGIASNFVGKRITATTTRGDTVSGTVQKAQVGSSGIMLFIDNQPYPIDSFETVTIQNNN